MSKKRGWLRSLSLCWKIVLAFFVLGFLLFLFSIPKLGCVAFSCYVGNLIFFLLTSTFLGFIIGLIVCFFKDYFRSRHLYDVPAWEKAGFFMFLFHSLFLLLAVFKVFNVPDVLNRFYLFPMTFAQYFLGVCSGDSCNAYIFFGVIWISFLVAGLGSLLGYFTDKTIWLSAKGFHATKKKSKKLAKEALLAEPKPKNFQTVTVIVLIVLVLPFFLLVMNSRLVAFDLDFYNSEFSKLDVAVKDSDVIADNLIYFLQYDDVGVEYVAVFDDQEISHLQDVRSVMNKFLFWFNVCFISLLILLILLFHFDKSGFLKNFSLSMIFGGFFISLLSLFSYGLLKNFDFAFNKFHSFFFSSGSWSFPDNSLLIRLFPKEFWVDVVNKVMGNVLVSSLLFVLLGVFVLFVVKTIDRRGK